jgi:hypothetical protein
MRGTHIVFIGTKINVRNFIAEGRAAARSRRTVLRTDQEIADALEQSETDELLSRAGSIDELRRQIGGELQLGKQRKKMSVNLCKYSLNVPYG